MTGAGLKGRAIAAVLAALLAFPCALAGCGPGGRADINDYTIKESGAPVGSQQVRIREVANGIVYSGTEKRPFTAFGTTWHRTLGVTRDLKSTVTFENATDVPGASYRTYMSESSSGDGFAYLANDLQTYEYVPLLPRGTSVLPLELDSACLIQALLDRFLAANVQKASAFAVLPSRGPVIHEIIVERRSLYLMHLSSPGLDEVDVEFDKNNFVTVVRTGTTTVERGSPPALDSRPYQPVSSAVSVSEVRVVTPEKFPNGDRLQLAGSLYFPPGASRPYRAVILTGDEGPQDRTGTGFLSQVADYLARQGFVVLTCDRRGVPESQGSFARHTRETLLKDLNTQVDYLVNRGDIDVERIALLGYGEGGLLSLAAAGKNPYVKRVVVMGTPSVTLFPDLMKIQIREALAAGRLLGPEAAYEQALVDALVETVSGTQESEIDIQGKKVFLDWMRSWMPVLPTVDVASLKAPVLVMHGTADQDVPAVQADELMAALAARPGRQQKLEMFEGLGHGFGRLVEQAKSKPDRAHPVVERKVLDALGAWLKDL
jgi:dienelactone hydrolase